MLELEFRLGIFEDNKFIVGIPRKEFYDLFNKISSNKRVEKEISLICAHRDIRTLNILDNNFEIEDIRMERKQKVKTYDLPKYNMRVSLAKEQIINKEKYKNSPIDYNCFRLRDRISKFGPNGNWRFDFTKVIDMKGKPLQYWKDKIFGKNIEPLRYEVEIEYIGHSKDPKNIKKAIKDLPFLSLLISRKPPSKPKTKKQFKELLFANKDYFQLTNAVYPLLKNDIPILKKNYSVTDKTDGERMLLLIDAKGDVYLINNVNDKTKLQGISFQSELNNSLIDGEYVDYLNKYYMFDILKFGGEDVRDEYLQVRYKLLNNFEKINPNIMKKYF